MSSKSYIDYNLLYDMYCNKKLSQSKIANMLNVQPETIGRWLRKLDISLRNRYDSVSLSLSKFQNIPFSGDIEEKAYLIGIRTGYLSAQEHGRKIRVSVSSSHIAMLSLFQSLFSKYRKVNSYPKIDKSFGYRRCVYCDLDISFSFLKMKLRSIPNWILGDGKLFFSFLSGYFDAEGCLSIYYDGKYGSINWIIKSYDKKLLGQIVTKLNSFGFRFERPRLAKKADNKNYNRNYWFIGTGRKLQIFKLLEKMSLKHEEKIIKYKLVKNLEETKWKNAKEKIIDLRTSIKNNVKNLTTNRMRF